MNDTGIIINTENTQKLRYEYKIISFVRKFMSVYNRMESNLNWLPSKNVCKNCTKVQHKVFSY